MRMPAIILTRLRFEWIGGAIFWACLLALVGSATAQGSVGYAKVADDEQARAALFVLDEFLDTGSKLEEVSRRYAQIVSYYDRGRLSRDAVMRDKAAYMRRWPVRRVRPDLRTLVVTTSGDGVFEVAVEIDFEVTNDHAQIAGRSIVDVVVRYRGDSFEVIGEGGHVISRLRRN